MVNVCIRECILLIIQVIEGIRLSMSQYPAICTITRTCIAISRKEKSVFMWWPSKLVSLDLFTS